MSTTRPPKRKSVAAEKAATFIAPHVEAILAKTVELAKAGDPKSQQLALAYGLGTPRPQGERLDLPAFAAAISLSDKAAVVAEALATGKITVEAADKLGRFLDTVARTAALEDLGERVRQLEKTGNARTVDMPSPALTAPAELAADIRRFAAGKSLADKSELA